MASPLPPSPDADVCECMYDALQCKPTEKILNNATAIGELFGEVCGYDPKACDGIQHDAKTGDYGLYSGCTPGQQLAHAMSEYYSLQNQAADACKFGGKAVLDVRAAAPSTCKDVLSSASASHTAAAGAGDGSNDKKDDGAAGLRFGGLAMMAYVIGAMAVGGAIVVL